MENNSTLTASELARVLRVSKRTIAHLMGDGMPCVFVRATKGRGRRPRFELNKVMNWLEHRAAAQAGKGVEA